jgi:hypothetical protein
MFLGGEEALLYNVNSAKGTRGLVKATQWMFYLNAIIWLVIGIVSLARMLNGTSTGQITALFVGVLMLGNVGAMLLAGYGIGRQWKLFYIFGFAVLFINIILTVTDQFGLIDLVTLIYDLALLGLLVVTRLKVPKNRQNSADSTAPR